MAAKIPTGTTLELGEEIRSMGRRAALKMFGGLAVGSLSLRGLVERVYGKKPEGRTLVYTDDIRGNPDRVKIVPKERYRRLSVYKQFPAQKMIRKNKNINAVSITQRSSDPEDIALQLLVDNNGRKANRKLPSRHRNVPVVYKENNLESYEENLEGGSTVIDPKTGADGGACLVGYDFVDTSQVKVVTADHVMNGNPEMYYKGNKVGDFDTRSQDMDVTAYNVTSGTDFDPTGTENSSIPDITGTWQFKGLSDKVGCTSTGDSLSDGDRVSVELDGAESGYVSDACNNTKQTAQVTYQADMVDHKTTDGDSGGPWVDANGKLLGVHHGFDKDGHEWSTAAIGRDALNAVGVVLSQ